MERRDNDRVSTEADQGRKPDPLQGDLRTLAAKYKEACRALEVFVGESLKSISQNKGEVDRLVEVVESPQALEVPSDEEVPSVERNADGSLSLRLDMESLGFLQDVVRQHRQLYDTHPQMLLNMALSHSFSLFDGLLSDVLMTVFRSRPDALRTNATLTYSEALNYPSREDLIEELARRRVLSLMYGSLEAQLEYLAKSFKVDVQGSPTIDFARLQQLRDRRNLIVHNNGRASAEYGRRHGMQPGSDLTATPEEAEADRRLLTSVGVLIIDQISARLTPNEGTG
ncbi:UNVERIFIED_ORG: hypothetical protein E4P37_09995 [Bacillus sp. AZ43]